MDFSSLIESAPELMQGLQGLGLGEGEISSMTQEIGGQLSGGGGLDIASLLGGLDAEAFLAQIDVAALASKVGISPEIAKAAVELIAPAIANFDGQSAAGMLAGMAKGLFK